jgi:hypothetical protein
MEGDPSIFATPAILEIIQELGDNVSDPDYLAIA